MKNGWYKVEYGKNGHLKEHWPKEDQIVYIENDAITETRSEWGKSDETEERVVVTDDLKRFMVKMEFDGIGCA